MVEAHDDYYKRFQGNLLKWPEMRFDNLKPSIRQEIVDWLEKSIEGYGKHVIWYHDDPEETNVWPTLVVKFRHERDLILCKLRWS
jgi:hypothetical protein